MIDFVPINFHHFGHLLEQNITASPSCLAKPGVPVGGQSVLRSPPRTRSTGGSTLRAGAEGTGEYTPCEMGIAV